MQNYNKGFSLIEIIIGIAAGGLILLGVLPLVNRLIIAEQQVASYIELQYETDFVMNSLTNDLRRAETVYIIANESISLRIPDQSKAVKYSFNKEQPKRMMKDNQPMTGETALSPIMEITEFAPKKLTERLVEIRITSENRRYKQKYSLVTAVEAGNIGR